MHKSTLPSLIKERDKLVIARAELDLRVRAFNQVIELLETMNGAATIVPEIAIIPKTLEIKKSKSARKNYGSRDKLREFIINHLTEHNKSTVRELHSLIREQIPDKGRTYAGNFLANMIKAGTIKKVNKIYSLVK